MWLLLILLGFPIVWPFISRLIWPREITWAEIGGSIGVISLVVGIGYWIAIDAQTRDQEVWNGRVVDKYSEHVTCEHTYQCNCYTTTDSKGRSTRHCSTCRYHPYDVDWIVKSDIGSVSIDRVDWQGVEEPPDYTRVRIGDPFAQVHSFTNWIEAAPDSLFHGDSPTLRAQFTKILPIYPLKVHDYDQIDRVLAENVPVPDLDKWNYDLAVTLEDLGPKKQANGIIVFTDSNNPAYADALSYSWLGGKKNDITVVFGTPHYPKIEWVRIVSWTNHNLFKVELRDRLQALGSVDETKVLSILHDETMKEYHRRHMKEFQYLSAEIMPSTFSIILLLLLAVGGSVGATWFFIRSYNS